MSDGKTDAWMPLWIGAYLADTQHLTRDEHGGYFLLLMAYWRARGPLPDDDKRLASIVKATPAEWRRLRLTLAEFFMVGTGVWWHKRVEAEIAAADKRKAAAVAKASKGGQALAEKRAQTASSSASSTPQAVLGECPTPSPEITPRPPSGVAPLKQKATRRCPPEFLVTAELQQWAREKAPLVDIRFETGIFRDVEFPKAHTDWPAAWRVWMAKEQRKHVESAKRDSRRSNVHDLETPKMRAERIRAEEISPLSARKAPTEVPTQPFAAVIEMEPAYARVEHD